jgi:hypothetical protein
MAFTESWCQLVCRQLFWTNDVADAATKLAIAISSGRHDGSGGTDARPHVRIEGPARRCSARARTVQRDRLMEG